MGKRIKHKPVGEEITVKYNNLIHVENACWERFRELKKDGLQAKAFIIKTIYMLKDGSGEATIQPIRLA